jgi:hypothetical protein
MDIKYKFLSGIVGKNGASALKKAIQRDSRLDSIVLPRAIIGWLNFISRFEYEGCLPGIEDSYIQFSKNEDSTYTGSIAIGEEVFKFDKSDIHYLASAISVAIGEDTIKTDRIEDDLMLVKLGKSIDALAKAQEISRTLQNRLNEESLDDLTKAISMIPKGNEIDADTFDYSHVLKPEHKNAGYSLKVVNTGESADSKYDKLESQLHHGDKQVGVLEAYHDKKGGVLEPDVAMMEDAHKGKGLGQSMYEAMFAHGYHNKVHTIEGGVHSTDADRVHRKLAAKHGMEYYANPRQTQAKTGAFDRKFGPYKYTLKQELPMDKTDLPGKTHMPTKQQGPTPPSPPTKQQKLSRTPLKTFKAPTLKVNKSEASKQCKMCDGMQFANNKFVGCICLKDLSDLIKTTAYSDGFALDFKKNFDKEAFLVLSKYFKG